MKLTKQDEVYFSVDCELEIAYELKDFFSCYAPNFKFHPRFRAKIWDGKISFFNYKTRLLPIGLLEKYIEFYTKNKYKNEYDFDVNEFFDNKIVDGQTINVFLMNLFSGVKLRGEQLYPRDYQIEAIKNSLYKKRGIVESPTGSGKSLIIYTIIRYILENTDKKVLLVVPNVSLVEQMYSDFIEYGWKDIKDYVDILYSGKMYTNKRVLVSTWQSIFRKGYDFFDQFEALLIDEVHQVGSSKSIQDVSKKCKKADYRLGFTGTLPDEDYDLYNIFGYLGPQIFELKTGDLIDKGVLSKIVIANIIYRYPETVIKENKNRPYAEEIRFIESYKGRYGVLKYIFKNVNEGENTLILCRHIDHLKTIENYLLKTLDDKYKVFVIYGNISAEEREHIRMMMEREDNMVLIGTYATMSTGVNIRRLHNIVFFSSYKRKIKILQSIGRGLRVHEDKDKLILWDVVDDLTWKKRTGRKAKNYVYKHFEERLKYYKNQGFQYYNLKL